MKKNIFNTSLAFAILLFISVSAFSQSDAELKQKIEKLNKEMAKSMLEGNTMANLSYYAPDAISMPNNGKMCEGVDAIKKSNEEMMSSGTKIKSFETNTSTVKSCGKMITEIGTYKISMSMPGMEKMEDHGKYVTIWEKQADGSLKIKVEIWNTDVTHEEQAQQAQKGQQM